MVISQIQDGGNGSSPLTKNCRQHAEHMGEPFIGLHITRLISSQSDLILTRLGNRDCPSNAYVTCSKTWLISVILACWSDVVWRPACRSITLYDASADHQATL
jgi:hypothetical protein